MAGVLEKAVKAGDIDAFNQMIDWDGIVARALTPSKASKTYDKFFADSTKKNVLSGIAKKTIRLVNEGSQFRCLRIHTWNGKKCILFRLLNADKLSLDYFEFELARKANGMVLISEYYNYRVGDTISQYIRQDYIALAHTVSEMKERGNIAPEDSAFMKNHRTVSEMMEYISKGDGESALVLYARLPNAFQNIKLVLLNRLEAAHMVGGKEYQDAMEAIRTTLPKDPCLDFVLLDYYFEHQQYSEMRAAIDRIDEQLGGDSYQDARRSITYMMEKNYRLARKYAQKAIDQEDTIKLPYFILLQTSLQEHDFNETARLLTVMEEKSFMVIPDLTTIPIYAEFVKSPQYQTWLKRTKPK
jgi:tetratricopeptide (TPR) repeat protein